MESTAQSIVSKLGQLVVEELQEIRGVGDKVVHLTDELATMNAVLRMISEADEGAVDHLVGEWEKQVRELAYDAEDCADIYRLRIISRPMPGKLLPYIVKWPKHQLEKLRLRHALAAEVKALLARAGAVSERRARYIISLPKSTMFTPVSAASASASALRRADAPDEFVGIKKQADTLAERIKAIRDNDDDKKLKAFSIVGFGGLGKTTLAVELCRQLEADFQRQALVSVSQAFDGGKDMKGLLARLLLQIVKPKQEEDEEAAGKIHANELKIDEMDVEGLSTKVNELLMEKRYLIVIDDVWSLPAWEAIRMRLPENNCGSRIIVTTRIETVAKASSVSEDFVHHMEPLGPEASKELFVKRVFGFLGTCPTVLEDTMNKILKKCGGLPLAIVKIASILASYNSAESVEMWRRVSNSIGSQMENHPTLEGMRQLITLSYGYLPHHLKACMMYLSIFPEDYMIAKDRLLYRWIAEGLVAEKRGLTLFEVAEEYFNELASRNMIQQDKLRMRRNYRYGVEMVEACRVHDMMLEVMVSRSLEANFVSLVGRQYGGGLARGKVRRLSVHGSVEDEEEDSSGSSPNNNNNKKVVEQRRRTRHGGIEAMKLQHVRSLTTFQVEGLGKVLDRLDEFVLLRVLDLEDCKSLQNNHMRDVCRLYLLRFLGLKGTAISVMPNEIGDLEYLESLDVEETEITVMPSTVTKLSKLERLRAPEWFLPQGIGNMKALREVSLANLKGHDVQAAREVGELQQLQVLSINLHYEVKAEEEFLHALGSSLSKTYALRTLWLTQSSVNITHSVNFLLHVSSPPPLLRCLTTIGHINQLPDWFSSLKHLAEFSVAWAELTGDQLLDSLCQLPSLQSLTLEHQGCKDEELVVRSRHKFPVLRILNLTGYTRTYSDVVKFEQGSMTKLETLLLGFTSYRETSIVGVGNLENLKEVELSGPEGSPSLRRALRQLKEENKNRPKSNHIKVVVE
ncbi:unnamed protein product [Urochloa decumbens]|uniref:Uncharacterized protein n=1 Tax=Urochloa decumbens TaxID=240449 RepID=A0ABC8ZLS8_9POAL